jgi:membrane dipeptidase
MTTDEDLPRQGDHLTAATAIISNAFVWDNHGCMPVGPPYGTEYLPELHRYRDAGVDVVSLNVGFGEMDTADHFQTLASIRRWVSMQDDCMLISTPADVETARQTGRLGICFDIEGANAIADQLPLIGAYHHLGVRWMLIAYNRNNQAGGGCQDEDTGLTSFGREVVREMERVGMVVCCSHTGYRTAADVLGMATKPVIFSHSNALALVPHPRNIPDDLIRACAQSGGVVGVNGIGLFLGPAGEDQAELVARHIDHMVQLVGPRHVGLGLDFVFDTAELEAHLKKMRATFPADLGYDAAISMVPPERLVDVVMCLLRRGYYQADLEAILGGNFLRVAHEAW